MKKTIIIILVTILIISLTGCGETPSDKTVSKPTTQNTNTNRFQPTGESYGINGTSFEIYVDTKTENLYLSNSDDTYYGFTVTTLCPLYDSNGKIQKRK